VLTSYPDGKVTAELLQLTEDSSIDRKVVDRIFASDIMLTYLLSCRSIADRGQAALSEQISDGVRLTASGYFSKSGRYFGSDPFPSAVPNMQRVCGRLDCVSSQSWTDGLRFGELFLEGPRSTFPTTAVLEDALALAKAGRLTST
jgi:hypothetical protein